MPDHAPATDPAADPAARSSPPASEHPRPFLVDSREARALHFNHGAVQSRMRWDDPDALDLAYTRLMMGFVLFVPQPRRIGFIGLGGGSLVKHCHRHLPQARLAVAEVNPHVLALRHAFSIPPDGDRLAVALACGARWVHDADEPFDALLIDGFGPAGMPEALASQRFFDDAVGALTDGGVLVLNQHRDDPRADAIADRLARSLDGEASLLAVDEDDGANRVLFGWRGRRFGDYRPGLVAGALAGMDGEVRSLQRALQAQGRTFKPRPPASAPDTARRAHGPGGRRRP